MTIHDVIDIGKKINDTFSVAQHLGDKAKIKEIYANFRKMGGEVSFIKGCNKQNKQMLAKAFEYYPEAWAEYLNRLKKKVYSVKVDRGFFAMVL